MRTWTKPTPANQTGTGLGMNRCLVASNSARESTRPRPPTASSISVAWCRMTERIADHRGPCRSATPKAPTTTSVALTTKDARARRRASRPGPCHTCEAHQAQALSTTGTMPNSTSMSKIDGSPGANQGCPTRRKGTPISANQNATTLADTASATMNQFFHAMFCPPNASASAAAALMMRPAAGMFPQFGRHQSSTRHRAHSQRAIDSRARNAGVPGCSTAHNVRAVRAGPRPS